MSIEREQGLIVAPTKRATPKDTAAGNGGQLLGWATHKERKMNVKTFVKTGPKMAQLTRSLKSPNYQTLASTKDLRRRACKNSPRKSVYCGDMSKLFSTEK